MKKFVAIMKSIDAWLKANLEGRNENRGMLLLGIVLLLVWGLTAPAQTLKTSDLEITPPKNESMGSRTIVAFLFLPAVDGFAANVTVERFPLDGRTRKEFTAFQVKSIGDAGWKCLRVDDSAPIVLIEFVGNSGGKQCHFYTRIKATEKSYVVATAVALEARWELEKAELTASVDSLK